MIIRLVNQNDWEKKYDYDKSIIRVGSQPNCDIQLRENSVSPLEMQIVRSGTTETTYVMRYFGEKGILTRGDQNFPIEKMRPYDILDGDKISFCGFRLIISLENEGSRFRETPHISAKMYLSSRELSPEASINGLVVVKNTGTDKPCQFRMRISGIPEECLQSAPMPFLHPGQSGSVGFSISHLQIKPAPGFHTVSIIINAPEEYYGELLEFNQDIYVTPVFKNEFTIEDDSAELTGFNKNLVGNNNSGKEQDGQKPAPITDARRLNPDESLEPEEIKQEEPVVVLSGSQSGKDSFDSEENQSPREVRRSRNKSVLVIRRNNENIFDGEETSEEELAPAEEETRTTETSAPEETSEEKREPAEEVTRTTETSAPEETERQKEAAAPRKTVRKNRERPEKTTAERNFPEDTSVKPEKISLPENEENNGLPEEPKPRKRRKAAGSVKTETKPEPQTEGSNEVIFAVEQPQNAEIAESNVNEDLPELAEQIPDVSAPAAPVSEEVPVTAETVQTDPDAAADVQTAEPAEAIPSVQDEIKPEPAEPAGNEEKENEPEVSGVSDAPETAEIIQPAEPVSPEPEMTKQHAARISDRETGKVVPVIVKHSADTFDEPPEKPLKKESEPDSPVKKIRVMKGGSFDD